jgi:hypothetical protein
MAEFGLGILGVTVHAGWGLEDDDEGFRLADADIVAAKHADRGDLIRSMPQYDNGLSAVGVSSGVSCNPSKPSPRER